MNGGMFGLNCRFARHTARRAAQRASANAATADICNDRREIARHRHRTIKPQKEPTS
jgi:hypothetical protein